MLFMAGISIGSIFTLNNIVAASGIPFVAYIVWQALGAALILATISLGLGKRIDVGAPLLRFYVVFGLIGLAGPHLIFNFVAPSLPAGLISLISPLIPMLTYACAILFRIEALKHIRLAGLLLGLAGVLVVILPEASLPSPDMTLAFLIVMLAPVSIAFSNIAAAIMRPPETTSFSMAVGGLSVGALFLLPLLAVGDNWWFFDGAMDTGHWAVIVAVFVNAVFFYLLFEVIHREGPVFFATSNYITTLAGVGWGMLLLDEAHNAFVWVALALLFAGLYLVMKSADGGPEA
jgi:drug/metabolite transporter (DMT)-like permease